MPKVAKELSDAAVRKLKHGHVKGEARPGTAAAKGQKQRGEPCTAYHPVGGVAGLLLCCKPSDARSWVLRTMVGDKRRDFGLGGYPDVTLAQAREQAREIKAQIRQGIDPLVEKKRRRSELIAAQARATTFEDVARKYLKKKEVEYKSPKEARRLTQNLESYILPHIGRMTPADIERAHIVRMLEPIWTAKHPTAKRVREATERILDLAGVEGLRSGDNPARWKGNLELSFPRGDAVHVEQHLNALPYESMPEFWRKLRATDSMASKALRFTILTGARSTEAREARWDEIDLASALWTLPGERTKSGRVHRVPLTAESVALLESMPRPSEYVFPGPKGSPISEASLRKLYKRLGGDITLHGFRTTFRTWAQEHTEYAEEVAELAISHVETSATRAAYARGELLDKRRLLMNDWERFILNGHKKREAKVVVKLR